MFDLRGFDQSLYGLREDEEWYEEEEQAVDEASQHLGQGYENGQKMSFNPTKLYKQNNNIQGKHNSLAKLDVTKLRKDFNFMKNLGRVGEQRSSGF